MVCIRVFCWFIRFHVLFINEFLSKWQMVSKMPAYKLMKMFCLQKQEKEKDKSLTYEPTD